MVVPELWTIYLDIKAMSLTGGGSTKKWKNDTHSAGPYVWETSNARKTHRTRVIFDGIFENA